MNKKIIITALLIFVALAGQAQTKVIGHVVNERGDAVEYVSIGIEEDSVGVISDAQGHMKGNGSLSFPANFKSSYARHKVKGKMKKIPGCPMIIVKGYEVE